MKIDPSIFKAYDVRGVYPSQINEDTARRIGQAYAALRKPGLLAIGRDVRLSSPSLEESLIQGISGSGVDVLRLGVIPTDQLYFAVGHYHLDGGITVTPSHNPTSPNRL